MIIVFFLAGILLGASLVLPSIEVHFRRYKEGFSKGYEVGFNDGRDTLKTVTTGVSDYFFNNHISKLK